MLALCPSRCELAPFQQDLAGWHSVCPTFDTIGLNAIGKLAIRLDIESEYSDDVESLPKCIGRIVWGQSVAYLLRINEFRYCNDHFLGRGIEAPFFNKIFHTLIESGGKICNSLKWYPDPSRRVRRDIHIADVANRYEIWGSTAMTRTICTDACYRSSADILYVI